MTAHVAHNSGNDEWYTPPYIVEAARRAMGGIDLDPATSLLAPVHAPLFYTKDDDGLAHTWTGRVWMNPPYSRPLLGKFVDKLLSSPGVQQACVLVNNCTETAAGQALLSASSAVCFLRGRVRYLDETGAPRKTPLQGQMVCYIGKGPSSFIREFTPLGVVLTTPTRPVTARDRA